MKVFALIRDFPIQTCDLSHTPPPTVRTFNFTRKCFVERPKFLQGVLQRLWVLYFLTRAQCQISVFHAEVCPNAFTCCRQTFHVRVGGCYAEPIVSAVVSLECDTTDRAVPLTVFMESIRDFIKTPFACFRIPLTEGERDTIIFQRPPGFSRKGDRLELMSRLDMRSAPKFLEKAVVCQMDTFQLLLNCLAWQSIPMRVRRLFQITQVGTHCLITRIPQSLLMPLTLPLMEILVDLPHIVKQVTNTACVRLFSKRVFIGFHGLSSLKSLTPNEWVGPTRYQAVTLIMSVQLDTLIILQFGWNVKYIKSVLVLSKRAKFHPKPEGLGFHFDNSRKKFDKRTLL